MVEVLSGHRPLTRLADHTTRTARDTIRENLDTGPIRATRVHLRPVSPTICEATGTVVDNGRLRAMLLRAELTPTGWICTRFRLLP